MIEDHLNVKNQIHFYGYLDFDYVTTDTLYLEEEHIHLEEEQLCSWSPAEKYIIINTIKVRIDRK